MLAQLRTRLLLAFSLVAVLMTVNLSISHPALAAPGSEASYYIKPVQADQVVVEPNYGQLLESEVDATEALSQLKEDALSEIQRDYEIKKTQPVWTQRHVLGDVPNLILQVESESEE
jgi:hypothetical protein